MKKKLVSLLLVAAMGVSMLVGCGGGSDTDTQAGNAGGNESGEVQDVTLKVWAPENQQELLETQQKEFAEANKDKWNITWVNGIVGEDVAKDEIQKDVEAAADVYFFSSDQLPDLVKSGAISKLGGDTEKMVKESMAENVVDTVTIDGSLYAIPFTHNTYFMYYDKTLLNEEDIKTIEGIVGKDTADGVYNLQLEGSGWYFGAWYYSNGLSLYGLDGTDLEAGCDWNNEKGVAVTNYVIDLVKNPKVGTTITKDELAAEHKLGAWFDGAWSYNTYHDVLGDDLGMAAIPSFTLDGESVQLRSFYSTKAIGVNPKASNPAAAVAFAAYLGSEEQQIARFEASAQVPANTKAASIEAVQNSPIAAVILEEVEKASIVQPTSAEFGKGFWNPTGAIVGDIETGKLTKDNVQSYLDSLVKSMTGAE
uniref:extracellular solute-binding protein n=1 Tax=Agathobacter sp. TaxID=2021311 RepID=UPI004057217F